LTLFAITAVMGGVLLPTFKPRSAVDVAIIAAIPIRAGFADVYNGFPLGVA